MLAFVGFFASAVCFGSLLHCIQDFDSDLSEKQKNAL